MSEADPLNARLGVQPGAGWTRRAGPLLAVFLLSIGSVILFWIVIPGGFGDGEGTDYAYFYAPAGREFLKGAARSPDAAELLVRNPPGYPLMLAVLFGLAKQDLLPVTGSLMLVVLLGSGLTSVFLFLLAWDIGGTAAGVGAAVLWLTYPLGLWLTSQPNSEIPFMAALSAAIWLFWRMLQSETRHGRLYALLAGLALAAAVLLRSIAVGLPIYLALLTLWLGRSRRPSDKVLNAALLAGAALIALLPWQIWASQYAGHLVLIGTSGQAGMIDGLTFAVNLKGYRVTRDYPPNVLILMETILNKSNASQLGSFTDILTELWAQAVQQPAALAKLAAIKLVRSWYGTDSGRLERLNQVLQGLYLAAVIPTAYLAWKGGSQTRTYVLLAAAIALYFWGMTVIALSIVRYMVPAMMFLVILIPIGLAPPLLSWLKKRGAQ